ncbi:uncharacterized protein LOC142574489 [Dermacentor variabilis]|uniref:uncharacterized protein LOC142574489 n=1 Tax=Dermacentor variabilis TaxID=34621 RepID=UPI003F5B8952
MFLSPAVVSATVAEASRPDGNMSRRHEVRRSRSLRLFAPRPLLLYIAGDKRCFRCLSWSIHSKVFTRHCSKSSPCASPDAPPEQESAAAPEEAAAQPPPAWASEALQGDVVVDDDGVVMFAPTTVEQVRTVTVSTLTRVHGAEYEQRELRSTRRQERSERRLQQQQRRCRAGDAYEEDERDAAAARSGGDEVHEDEDGGPSSRQSLLLFVVATAILVVCMVAGFISIALLEQVERRKKRVSIDAPDSD